MLLHSWLNLLRRLTLPPGFGGSHKRSQRLTERFAQPTESLEARVLLTIDMDQPFSVPGGPMAHVSERFDANASYDLVTLSASGNLTVAFNHGDGSWSSIKSTGLGLSDGVGLAAGRVNSDPFADLAIQSAENITIAVSTGAGEFLVTQTLTPALPGQLARSGGLPVGLTFGLFDQDLSTDLAVVVPGTNELLVYRGLSNGSFGTPARHNSGGTQPVAVVTGQFVGSTASDLALAHGDGTVTFFAGDGSGGFSLHSGKAILAADGISPAVIRSIAVDDFNGDDESDLAVTAIDTAVVLLNTGDTLESSPIVNGRFDQGLAGWTTQIVGHVEGNHDGTDFPGVVSGLNGFARFTENQSFLTSLQQTFTVPASPQTLSFEVRSLGLQLSASGIPDAFEVSLLNSDGNSLVATHRPEATSFYNVDANGQTTLASGVTINGTTVTVDISTLPAGTHATLYFDLVGNPPGTSSTVVLDNVVITPERITNDSFNVLTLPGSFQHATGVDSGDINGDGLRDVLITDRAVNSLLVFTAATSGGFTRTDVSLAAFGTQPVSVIATALRGSSEDDIAVGLYGSDVVVSPLMVDHTPPLATLISPVVNVVNTGVGNTIVVEFSEPMHEDSVATLAPWRLTEAGMDGVFGTSDDVQIPLQSATWDSSSRRASLTLPLTVIADGNYQLVVEGANSATAVVDLSGNRLNNGADQIFGFIVNSDGPEISSANSLSGSEGQTLTLVATVRDPGSSGPHAVTVDWGDGTTSATSVYLTGGTGTISLPHVWTQDGLYSVTISVTDPFSHLATAVVSAVIVNVNPTLTAPIVSAVSTNPGLEGALIALQAAFTDTDDTAIHTAMIHWGDGTATAGTVTFASGAGTVTGNHVYADDGDYDVSVTVTDSSALSGSRATTATIANFMPAVVAATSLSVIVGMPLSGVIATFTDQGYSDATVAASETFVGTINWGDGTLNETASLTITNGAAGVLTRGDVAGTHTFAGIGTYTASITVSDDDGGVGTAEFQVTVIAAPQPPAISGPATVAEGSLYALTLHANDYSPTAWNINWGDGTFVQTVPGNVTSVGHTWADNQLATITATAVDNGGTVTTAPLTVTIFNIAPVIAANGLNSIGVGATYSLSVSASDPGTDIVSSWIVEWGDGATSTVAGTLTTLTHVYTVAATRTIRVSAVDEDGTFAGPSKTISVIPTTVNKPRFFVVDSQTDKAFRYGTAGSGQGDFTLGPSNNVRGVTTTGAGNPIWTVDNDDKVYVYDSVAGTLLGSWLATSVNNPEDIATDGTDIWIVDRSDEKVYRFNGGASRRSGSQSAVSSFSLHGQNKDAYGIVTDGTTFWVVDKNSSTVFIYNVSNGAYLGKWTIDSRNKQPSGITIDPNGGDDMWIVDRHTNAVYRYANARTRLSGSLSYSDAFRLGGSNSRPEGIADPTFAYTLGTVVSSNISVPGEVDEYQFTASAGQRVFFDIQLVQNGVLHANLRNPDGSNIVGYGFGSSPNNPQENDGSILLTQTGTYTMRLESLTGDTPSYQVVVNDVTVPDTATITLGTPLSGQISVAGETDEWLLNVTSGQNFWFEAISQSGYVRSRLYSPSGALVFHELSPGFAPTTLSETGTYRLVLNGLYDRTPSYSFQVRDTSPVFRNMQIGETASATISSAQSKDIWRFNATAGQSVYLDFQQATDSGVQYSLVAPNGALYASAGNFLLSALDQGPILLNQSGTWELRINGPGTTTPTYRFQLWNVPAPEVYTVVLNDLYLGNIESPGREDVFEFHGYAGQQIYIDFQQNGAWLDWAFRKSDGTLIRSASAFLTSQLDGGPITIPADGIYRLIVRGHGDAVGDFQLRFFDITPSVPTPIVFDQIVTGSLNRPGQTPTFSFTGTAGSPLRLDVLFNQGGTLAWKLISPSGSTLFLNAATSQTIPSLPESGTYLLSVDQLNGAAPDTTGQFSFRVINPNLSPPLPSPADLVVSSVVRPPMAVGASVSVDVTWTVTNSGTGATTAATWADRIYLSADNVFQRAVDQIAGEFSFSGTLAPGASYTQTRTITVPIGYEGDLTVIVETDALNQVFELTNEANNTLISKPTAIYLATLPNGPPAITLDVTDGQRFPQGSTITLSGTASVLPATANLVFAIDLSASTAASIGSDANFDGIANAADDLNKDGSIGDILDVEIGSLLRILQNLRDIDINAMVSIVAFATFADHADLSPLVFNQTFASPTADVNGNGRFDIDEAVLSMKAGRVDKFREFELSIGTNFETTTLLIDEALERALPAQKTQVIFLTDGGASAPTSALLNRLADRGIDFFGFQISGTAVTTSLQFMADTIDANAASSGHTQLISDPQDLGAALLQSLQIVDVTVNGTGVQALDVNGHFFAPVTIPPGSNVFVVEATDSAGRTTSATVTLVGISPLDPSATQQQDVTNRATTAWTHTTFNRFTQTLHADLALTNTSTTMLDAPVIAVFDSINPLAVDVASSEGLYAGNNRPFVRFDSEFEVGGLLPGQTSVMIPVQFSNPLLNRFNLDVSLVGQGNSAPWFTSIPSVEATTNVTSISRLTAVDPDAHALTYQIVRGPVGMTVTTTTAFGSPLPALSWTPSAADAGTHDIEVRVTDGHGGDAVQSWQLTVQPPIPLPNLAPWFRSTPVLVASAGISYSYTPLAIDPEGLNVTLQLVSGPTGLSFVNVGTTAFGFPLSALDWTPVVGDLGPHTVQVRATDPSGQAAFQTWTLHVKGPNTPPQITTSPVISVIADSTYRYDVDAIDADDAVRFELVGFPVPAPAGMEFNPATGQIVWQTSNADIGSYPLTVHAIDERGAMDSQSFVLVVSPDTQAPQVTISLSNNVVSPGESMTITVNATDNVNVVSRTLTVNGAVLTLNADYEAMYTATTPGLPTIVATAVDAQGNIGTDQARLRIIDPTDITAPVITVTSPQPADIVTYLTDIVGSIIDANLESYSVAWSPIFASQWTTFLEVPSPSQGDGLSEGILPNVSNATIATFDPTLLMNDAFDIRITATDISGNNSTYTFELDVQGNAKIGNFHLDFTDLTIPLAGIPITISRAYDTLMANQSGDFGYGWMMSLSEGGIRETRPVKENESLFDNFAFRTGTRVYINTPSGKRVGFTFDPIAEATLLGSQFHPHFTADPGVYERLEVEDVPLRQNPDGTFKLYFGAFNYNPHVYTLITKDQVRYTYDQFEGLLSIADRNDVRLTYTDTGITSSIGQSITWTRDSFGRITRITDPAGNHISYGYNTDGDLISVTDQIGNATTMSYLTDPPHFLAQAIDSLGHIDFTATFDASGRLHTFGDALGNTSTQTYDLANNQEIIADRLGNESILTFNDRGNVTAVTDARGFTTSVTYNNNDEIIRHTDARGYTTLREFDDRGNVTRMTDAEGGVWLSSYNQNNDMLSRTDALGRTMSYSYDANGNLIGTTDAAGVQTTIGRDTTGRPVSMTDSRGFFYQFEYTTSSAVDPSRVINPDGTDRKLTFNQFGEATSLTNERGDTVQFLYNSIGQIVATIDPLAGATSYTYDGANLVSATDMAGATWHFEYDIADRKTREIDPLGGITQYSYNANNQLLTVVNAIGGVYSYTYAPDGRTDSVTDPMGGIRTWTYDASGNMQSTTDPRGEEMLYEYDGLNRRISEEHHHPSGMAMLLTSGSVARTFQYDAVSNLVEQADENGHVTLFTYDDRNRLITREDALGGMESWTYDEGDNVTAYADAIGRTTRLVWDSMSRLVSQIDALGFTTNRDYDDAGNLTRLTDARGNPTQFTYDSLNRLTSVNNALDGMSVYNWDPSGNLTSFTDARGNATTFDYDVLRRQISMTDALGGTQLWTHDSLGNVLTTTNERGDTTTLTYDLLSRITSSTNALGFSTQFDWDPNGNPTSVIDARNNSTLFEYDGHDRLIAQTDAVGGVRTWSYDPVGNLKDWTNERGDSTSFDYDALDRLTTVTDAIGGQTSFGYDEVGNRTQATDARGNSTTWTWDAVNRLSTRIDALGHTETFAYDGESNLTAYTDQIGAVTALTYDALNRVATRTDARGAVSTWGYDANGNQTAMIDPLGRRTISTYDTLDRLTTVVDPRGGVTSFGYDAASNRTSITDPLSQTSTFAWDAIGQMTSETDPLGHSRTYQYDPVGNLSGTTDKNGRVRQFEYDALNRNISEFWLQASSVVQSFTYTYDAASNLASAADTGSSYTMTWDALDRMTQISGGTTSGIPATTLNYGYDAVGNVITRTDQSNVTVTSSFDALNQLSSRTWSGGDIAPARIDYSYDARGGRDLMERFSDVTGTLKVGKTSYEFDAVGDLTDLTHLNAVDAVFSDFHFDWNLASEMTSRTEDGQITNYLHDATGQLTSADYATQTDEAYSYDANGNRQATGLTIGPNNQVLADSTYTYQYDAEGNLTRRTETVTGKYTQYTFDFRNRMVAATNFSAGGTVLQNVDFAYDVFDRRMTKTVDADGAGPLAPVTTHTVYDGQHAWVDLDAAGNVVARYLFGPSIDEIVARWTPASGTAWYVTDQLGSVRYLLNSTGTVINSIIYDSFGNIASFTDASGTAVSFLDPQSSSLLRFTFTGREFDAELDFYYYRARYYDPHLGRFISQDPISFAAGDTNLYRYVSNSPLTFVDPSGNDAVFYGAVAAEDSRVIASGLGAVFGFACGWVSGWYSVPESENDGEKFGAALSTAMNYYAWGAAIGYALGPIAAAVPQFNLLQTGGFLTISIALTIRETHQMAADDRNNGLSHEAIWRKQVACVIAPAVAGGVFAALDDLAKLRQPVSRFLNSETGTFDPSFSLGKPKQISPRTGQGPFGYPSGTNVQKEIVTPYGIAVQEQSSVAFQVRSQIQQGGTVYKGGVFGRSETGASQFLATENPLNPGYAGRYGLPPGNSKFDFILGGKVLPNAPVVTRSAPGIPPNPGGGIEGVVNSGNFLIDWFHMPD